MYQTPKWEDKECNSRLLVTVAEDMNLPVVEVERMVYSVSEFVHRTIRSGSLEGVCIPYLGKIQVKLKDQQYKAHLHSLHPVIKKEFQKLPSKNVDVIFEPEENP